MLSSAAARHVPKSLPSNVTDTRIVAVIPARYGSTRLPGKPLSDIAAGR